MSTGPNNIESAVEHRLAWLTRLLGVGVLALVAATWKLWTPQDVFPRVPLFRWAPPDWCDWTSLGLIVVGGCGLGIGLSRLTRPFSSTLASGLAIAFLCDQHRLQPWAWQFFILALILALADKSLQWHGWRWLVISIYFYSALSKFDVRFLHTLGDSFSKIVLRGFHAQDASSVFQTSSLLDDVHYYTVWLFPIGELTLAVLLAIPRTRQWGMWGAIGMHGFLLQILGPFGLNHSYGVLLWNVVFIVQAALLFMSLDRREHLEITASSGKLAYFQRKNWKNHCARAWLAFVLLWPATYPLGFCDAWLGWAVYVEPFPAGWLDVRDFARDHITVARRIFGESSYVEVTAGPWSLRELNAPIYPHVRSTVAAALELGERFDTRDIGLDIYDRERWQAWSFNPTVRLQSTDEIHAYAKRFWFNAYPTSMYRRAAKEKMRNDDG